MKKKQGNFINALLVLILLVGLSLLLYPSVSDYWNSFHQTRAIASYAEQIANLDNDTYDQLWEDARAYKPETEVMGVGFHALEWLFVRLAPIALLGSVVGVVLTREKK